MVKKIIKYVLTTLTVLFFTLSLLVMFVGIRAAVTNKPMTIFGYMYSVVPTESMKPEINPGDFVLSKKVDYDTLEVGDDIVYYSKDKNIYIVHRILEKNTDGSFVMKGINNPVKDDELVTQDNYIAKVVKVFGFLHLGNIVIENRGIIFGFLIFIFLGMVVIQGCKIFITIREEKMQQEEDERQKEKDDLTIDKEKLRQEILKELEEENEKAKQSKDCDAKL